MNLLTLLLVASAVVGVIVAAVLAIRYIAAHEEREKRKDNYYNGDWEN